jgi:hypothetical protein
MGSGAPPWALRGLGSWGGLGDGLALSLHTTQQVIRAHAEHGRNLDEQFGPRLLFTLLDLGEMLAGFVHPSCQLALIPSPPGARLGDALANDRVNVHGRLLFLS